MARPRHDHPTPAELEILKIVWGQGAQTGRQVHQQLDGNRARAYTSVMSLLNTMAEKGLLARKPEGRAFVYSARVDREKTLGRMVADLLGRAFEGSTSALVAQLLAETAPDRDELNEIRETIRKYQQPAR